MTHSHRNPTTSRNKVSAKSIARGLESELRERDRRSVRGEIGYLLDRFHWVQQGKGLEKKEGVVRVRGFPVEKRGAPIRAGKKNRKMGLEPRPVIEAYR